MFAERMCVYWSAKSYRGIQSSKNGQNLYKWSAARFLRIYIDDSPRLILYIPFQYTFLHYVT